MEMARSERAELADFLETLAPHQWDHPTLCAGWSVKDVISHVVSYEELGFVGLTSRFARGRIVRANQVGVEDYAALTPPQLVQFLRDHLQPRGLTAGFGGMIALLDATIHHQDIRRPLGVPRRIPADRLSRALELMPWNVRLGVPWRIRGLRLSASDLEWSCGSGPDLTGPGEALLMAMAGRPDAVSELDGSGVATFASRLT